MKCYPIPGEWLATLVAVAVFGFAVVAATGKPLIIRLQRVSFRQQAYEDAPATHASKTGTPTMGGLLFALALFLSLVLCCIRIYADRGLGTVDVFAILVILLGLGCCAIGFADDYAGVIRGKNKGLSAFAKFGLTAVLAAVFLWLLAIIKFRMFLFSHEAFDYARFPQFRPELGFGVWMWPAPLWLWCLVGLCAIIGTIHAVNLTDGLDGLAAGTIVPPLLLFTWIGIRCIGITTGIAYVDALVAGAAGGFLLFNRHPARVFMGDTGSLLLGGVLAGSAVVYDQQLLLILAGGVFVAEALSVMIQVAYFKRTKKRIFRMSPLHHHFELGGWPETKVTARFWAASAALSLLGAAIVGIGYAT